MSRLQVVVGGQFGSEGKGALAAWLVRREWKPILAIRVAGPNAGHTAYDDNGIEFKLQQIPVAAVVTPNAPGQIALAIAAGSEIDNEILQNEIDLLNAHGHNVHNRLFIDAQATLIESKHVSQERGFVPGQGEFSGYVLAHGEGGLTKRIGSTGKGIGAARAARIMREAQTWAKRDTGFDVAKMARAHFARGHNVQVEGTQGFGLGLHAGYYPYCTSSDCRAIDFLSMAGISPWAVGTLEVWVALRTHPIRVAGDSGPLWMETTWGNIGQAPELTTVTKKVRRVGMFDVDLARRAIEENGGKMVKVALMFGDYVEPSIAGLDLIERKNNPWLTTFETLIDHPISAVGTGPKTIAEVI